MSHAQAVAPTVIVDMPAEGRQSDPGQHEEPRITPDEEIDERDLDEDDAEVDVDDDDDAETDADILDPEFDTDEIPDENLAPPRTPLGPR